MTDGNRLRLVIIGGGAAGMLIAEKLANVAGLDITLIDFKSFYEYTPALCSVLFENTEQQFEKHFNDITFDYEPYLKKLNIKFKLGKVESVSTNKVQLVDEQQSIDFDYCVICTGSSYAEPWKVLTPDEKRPAALTAPDRMDFLSKQRQMYRRAQNILCIGAGPVGIALVAEIACRAPEKRITLVDMADTVLPSAPVNIRDHVQKAIKAKPSIQLVLGDTAKPEKDIGYGKTVYVTEKTKAAIKTDQVYNCIGIKPITNFLDESWLDDKKQVDVDEYFRVKTVHGNNVFAVGDVNSIPDPKMFYAAHLQAVHFVNNMRRILNRCRTEKGGNCDTEKELLPYTGARTNIIVPLGPDYAVAHISGFDLTGWPFYEKLGSRIAALSKYWIERITLNDLGLKVPFNNLLYYTQEKSFGGLKKPHAHSS